MAKRLNEKLQSKTQDQVERYLGKKALMESWEHQNPIVYQRLKREVNRLRKY
jgi:hypothetical protein